MHCYTLMNRMRIAQRQPCAMPKHPLENYKQEQFEDGVPIPPLLSHQGTELKPSAQHTIGNLGHYYVGFSDQVEVSHHVGTQEGVDARPSRQRR